MVEIIKVKPDQFKTFRKANTVLLAYNTWNDFGYCTTLDVRLFDQYQNLSYEGLIQIYTNQIEPLDERKYCIDYFLPNEAIISLGESFCSLGSSLNYYIALKATFPNDYVDILKRLRDIAFDKDLWERFKSYDGVQRSLLRASSSFKARKEAYSFLNGDIDVDTDLSFSYEAHVPYSELPVKIDFNFSKDKYLPYRINAIIGKNGVGKTNIIRDLATDISGFGFNESDILSRRARFVNQDGRPSFNKVISISLSFFDPFDNRRGPDALHSYVYCGIKTATGVLSLTQIRAKIKENILSIMKNGRFDKLSKVLSELFKNENDITASQIMRDEFDNYFFSSGECILVYSMTEAILQIERESIIIFDEPELHLHPNAIANVMRMLYSLLEEFDSYAIVATHSPIILQEIPSRNVSVLRRTENIPFVKPLEIESFGENISIIVRDAFFVAQEESFYQSVFSSMKKGGIEKEKIIDMFNDKLGLNALMTLEEIFSDD